MCSQLLISPNTLWTTQEALEQLESSCKMGKLQDEKSLWRESAETLWGASIRPEQRETATSTFKTVIDRCNMCSSERHKHHAKPCCCHEQYETFTFLWIGIVFCAQHSNTYLHFYEKNKTLAHAEARTKNPVTEIPNSSCVRIHCLIFYCLHI